MIGIIRNIFLQLVTCTLLMHSASGYGLWSNLSVPRSTNPTLNDEVYSENSRKVRSTDDLFFEPIPTCSYSENEINGVVASMTMVATQTHAPKKTSENLLTSSADTTPCEKALLDIQNLSNKLVEDYQILASNDNRVSVEEYAKLKATFESDKMTLQKQVDNIKQSVTQESQLKFNKVVIEMQRRNSELTTALNKLEAERESHMNTKISLCVNEIINNRLSDAKKHFNEINDQSRLGFIIKSAYNGNVNNANNILKFARILDTIELMARVYELLFKEMQRNYHTSSPMILELYYRVDETMKTPNYYDANQASKYNFESLKRSIETPVTSIVNSWSVKIIDGDHWQIIEFARNYEEALNMQLSKLVNIIYARGYVENILSFARVLPLISQEAMVYEALFDLMHYTSNKSHTYIMLALAVKTSMGKASYPNLSQEFKNKLQSLKTRFTAGVQNIIWASRVCFINHEYNEPLYASGETKDSDRRHVYTWKPEDVLYDAYWIIEPVEFGAYFHIKNTHFREYLYAANGYFEYDDDRRRPFTWRPGVAEDVISEWRIEPTSYDRKFYLKNKKYQEYLYAAGGSAGNRDGDRRRVFTWQPKTVEPTKGLWEIKPC